MARFKTTGIETLPQPKVNPHKGERKRTRAEYQAKLQSAIQDGDALIVNLDPDDNPMTIRYRIEAAAKALGVGVAIKKLYKRPQIIAYSMNGAAIAHKPPTKPVKVPKPAVQEDVDVDELIANLTKLLRRSA